MFPADNSQRDALRFQVIHKPAILLLTLAFPWTYHKEIHQLYCQLITAAAVISRLESLIMLLEGFYVEGEIPLLNLVIVAVLHFVFLDIIFKVIPLLASSLTKPL